MSIISNFENNNFTDSIKSLRSTQSLSIKSLRATQNFFLILKIIYTYLVINFLHFKKE